MTPRDKRIKKKRRLLIVEIIILAVVALLAFGSGWLNKKLGLIQQNETDEERLITASEANGMQAEDVALEGKDMLVLVGLDTREGENARNSDTMIIASIDHDKKTVKLVSLYRDTYLNVGEDHYTKCNSAYNTGGPEQMLSMMNLNLDLNLTEYVTVNFQAVVDTLEILGGIDIELSRAEMENINMINAESALVTGYEDVDLEVPDESEMGEDEYRLTHLNPTQGLTYARIRYTTGNDFRRTARQRILIQKMLEKTKASGVATMNKILDKVLPQVETNMQKTKLLTMVQPLLSYTIEDSVGFPFAHYEDDNRLTGLTCVVPVTLESNVKELHDFLADGSDEGYTPSETVMEYSDHIVDKTGLTEDKAPETPDNGELPWVEKQKSGGSVEDSEASEESEENG